MIKSRILIVEDEAVTSLALSDSLDSLGYEPIGPASSGEEAISLATSQHPDLVLMDIRLKGSMDGIVAADKIWNKHAIPIVFLTAYADEETLSRAKITRPFGYILKPFKDLDLHATIQVALENFQSLLHKKIEHSHLDENSSHQLESQTEDTADDLSSFNFLKRVEPFRQITDSALIKLAKACSFQAFKNNDSISLEGDEQHSCFIVATGRVALLKTSHTGKELTVALLPPGDVFGVAMALDDMPCRYTALAHGDTTVLTIPTNLLRETLSEIPQLYKEFHEEITEKMQRSHDFSLRLAHERVEVRVAAALKELASEFGSSKNNEKSYKVTVTRQQLSQVAGTTPETTIRITRAMEKAGILDLSRPGVIIIKDLDQLDAMTENIEAFNHNAI